MTHLVGVMQRLAARLDPDSIPDVEVGGLLTDLGQLARLAEGMTTLLARRAFDTATATGPAASREVREQVAAATGTTVRQAATRLETSIRLGENQQVAAAVRAGSLSTAQADAVTDAAAAAPDMTGMLLAAAQTQSVQDLKRTCRDARVAADPDLAATRRRHHRDRCFRAWSESDGEWKAYLSGPADAGARIEAAIRGVHDQVFKAAHAEGRREQDAAYRFDALLATLAGAATDADGTHSDDVQSRQQPSGSSRRLSGRQTKVIVTIDAAALKRGEAQPGERCEIAGVGQVPVDAVRELIPDAHLAYVIRNAVDASVAHVGRQVTAHQRTALEARGYECEVPGCRATHLLEIDHVTEWAISKQTRLDQLAWLCRHHHRDKTRGDHRLTGPPGGRRWVTTDSGVADRPGRTDGLGAGLGSLLRTRDRLLKIARSYAEQPWIGQWRGHPVRCDPHGGYTPSSAERPSARLAHAGAHGWTSVSDLA